jgi:hypothetical protein
MNMAHMAVLPAGGTVAAPRWIACAVGAVWGLGWAGCRTIAPKHPYSPLELLVLSSGASSGEPYIG